MKVFFSHITSVMAGTNGSCLEAIGDILHQVILAGDESGKGSHSVAHWCGLPSLWAFPQDWSVVVVAAAAAALCSFFKAREKKQMPIFFSSKTTRGGNGKNCKA